MMPGLNYTEVDDKFKLLGKCVRIHRKRKSKKTF